MNTSVPTELAVSGMTCQNCARNVTGILQNFPGVASANVSLAESRASVRWHSTPPADVTPLLNALAEAGYPPRLIGIGDASPAPKLGGWALNLLLGVPVTLVLMLGEWVFRLGDARWFAWFSFALAGAVQLFCGAKFYRGAWAQLKARSANMDTLVALGSTTAFGYSAWALLAGWLGHLYFMEAAAIITLISVGHWIEARVSEKAASSLKALMTLAPQTARRIEVVPQTARPVASSFKILHSSFKTPAAKPPETAEVEVPVAELQIGDRVALRPGDRIPVDGEVLEGASAVDESMLTGESKPVEKSAGQRLYAGTTNLNGRLILRVTATGEATALAHIIAAVQRAQNSRADIQRLGDRVSNVFVPIVCVIALATAAWWGFAYEHAAQTTQWLGQFLWHAHPPTSPLAAAVIAAAAVFIVACPCAMGLATPAAIMAAANAAARRGILIRDGVALEKAGRITVVLFDKTGTLTCGMLAVADIWQRSAGVPPALPDPTFSLRLAGALAQNSAHPVSRAIAGLKSAALSRDAAASLADWREVRGAGVVARLDGFKSEISDLKSAEARLGSLRWLAEFGVNLSPADGFAREWSAQGASLVGLALGDTLLAMFAVRDELKPGACEVTGQLQRGGLKTFLVSGDNAATATAIAKLAGIPAENVFAEVRPELKAEFVRRLQARGERVAFVGDGINDAPALEQADLGIAVSRASDVAREAADLILLKSEIQAVPESLGLARAALRTIKQNLFWAFFYNVAFIPLAALGFMSPVLCAVAMGASDLIVIGNALRLRRWRQGG